MIMQTVDLTLEVKRLLRREADYLHGRVREYLGLKPGMSPHKDNRPKRKLDFTWSPDDAVAIINLLSVYNTVERYGEGAMKLKPLKELVEEEIERYNLKEPDPFPIKKKKVIKRKKRRKIIRHGI